ncbi:MAG: Isoprenyl transferase [Thermoanaerobacterales bacterium 50_218]|nr:MAG: Isoprenyl transferase [Thermoanaerobacterales bacterium 50_218]HAA90277.1 isoprenyl transferase [Peptococcaceae bacterium]
MEVGEHLSRSRIQELLDAYKVRKLRKLIDPAKLPTHVAIIMDGNGRWAKARGLPRFAGHRAGVETLRVIVRACLELGIKVLTVYAFSTENWKRPEEEVRELMNLLCEYIRKEVAELHRHGVQMRTIGCIEELPLPAQEALKQALELTAGNKNLILNIALNYGGRREIVEVTRKIAQKVKRGEITPEMIDEELFSSYLDTAGLPDPDLLIRPAGELRISNFLLWQVAYTEFWNTSVFWPDFREVHFLQALVDYQKRERRFGGL